MLDISSNGIESAAPVTRRAGEAPTVRVTRYPARSWQGVTVEILELHGPGRLVRTIESEAPSLLVMLEEVGGRIEVRSARPGGARDGRGPLSFIPARAAVTQSAESIRFARQALFTFAPNALARTLGEHAGPGMKLMFSCKAVAQLAGLLAAECCDSRHPDPLYGEGLALALLTALTGGEADHKELARGGLAPHHVLRVTKYIEERWNESIKLQDLAELTGLSPSQFGRMFKASTGHPPHRWHLNVRIKRAQEMLIRRGSSATEVAIAAGFADQSHFTRTFRQVVGVPPGVWQRQRAA